MINRPKKMIKTFNLETEVIDQLEELYVMFFNNKDRKSKSAIVALAIQNLWKLEND